MKEQGGGKIINVASLATVFGLPMRTPYTAAKSGVAGLTRALAVEWAPYNIRVNAIAPGYFRTEMTEPLFSDPEWTRRLLERIPMQRTGVPEDLAGTAVFLASQASDYVTGQVIYVDGGYSAGWPDRPVFDQYKERLTKQNLRDKMSAAIGMVEEDVVSRGDLSSLEASGAIGIIRIRAGEDLVRIAQALREGGLSCLEITMNTPGALRAIEEASANLEGVTMGAGTVLDAVTARQAILAGAQFLVTPTVKLDVLEMAHRYGVPAIIGAMTPTEILTAWEAGADMVKIFPACILGPKFIQEVHGPLPQIPLVPTGGITADNAPDFIRAGAALVCVGGWLVDKRAVAEGRYEVLTENARRLVAAVRKARNP
jgi:2-dehydro-3-deoxyphosphogluconate aldolase/(4S)-4-hydroxy-2-oxoglutarate aldolase